MADSTIPVARTLQYSSRLDSLSQQKKSKTATRCRVETIVGAKAKSFERLGEAEGQTSNTRHGATPLNEQPHSRRWVTMTDTDTGTLLDKEDTWKILIEPANKYMLHQSAFLGRTIDDKFFTAATGPAVAGEEMGSTVLFKDDSVSINGDGTLTTLGTLATPQTEVNMTLAKMLIMAQIFNQEDVDPDIRKYWAVTPKDISDMLDLTEVGSNDFNIVKTLVEGMVSFYMGFNFFWSNRLDDDTTDATCARTIAWAEDGMILGQAKAMTASLDKRPDLKNALQIYSVMSNNAVRFEGAKVHECLNKIRVGV